MNLSEEITHLQAQLATERRARKKAEDALNNKNNAAPSFAKKRNAVNSAIEASKLYSDIYNNSHALICSHDMKGNLLAINPTITRVMGYAQSEVIGKSIANFMPENLREYFEDNYLNTIKRDKRSQGLLSLVSKSGKEIYQLYHNFLVETPGREPYVLGYAQDITDRINAERSLKISKKTTEDEANAKEAFLANMSHEIRTPMNGILGVAGLLAKTSLDDQQQNFLRLLQDSANNLLAIVNDVLDLEKIIAGKLQLEALPFKIVDKVAITIQSFIYRAEEKGVAIVFQNSIPGDLVVSGDPFRLSQILNNLLSNALKFTEKGKIVITSRIKSIENDRPVIEFSVRDTGIGISEENMKQIFQPFVQANSSISRKYGGTGLGLTICKNLLDMQGGGLFVESKEHMGSIFSFHIPYDISQEAFQEAIPESEINYASLGKKKVLVAEDVELNQFIAKHIMESWGLEVTLVSDGLQAIEKVKKNNYDLVLMDIQMPEMDGMAATKEIRAMNDLLKSSLPIIALTANALKNDASRYLALGMNDHVTKPFTEASLYKVVSKYLSLDSSTDNLKTAEPEEVIAMENVYDLAMIRGISGGDEEFVYNMILLFIETVPETLHDLNRHFAEENWDMVSKMAHKLKSTVDSMGIKSIYQDIRSVELFAKKVENLSEMVPMIRRINSVIETSIEQLREESESLKELS